MRSTDIAISFFTFLTVLANLATVGIVGLAAAARWSRAGPARRLWLDVRAELADGGLALAWLVAVVATSGSLWFSEVAGFQPCRLCWIQRACMYPLTVVLAVAALARHNATAAAVADDRDTAPEIGPTPTAVPAGSAATATTITAQTAPPPAPNPSGSLASEPASASTTPRQPTPGAGQAGEPAMAATSPRVPALRAAHASGLVVALAAVGAVVATYHVLLERFPSLEAGACDPQVPCTLVWFERLGFITLPYMALSGFVLILTLVGAAHVRPQEISS